MTRARSAMRTWVARSCVPGSPEDVEPRVVVGAHDVHEATDDARMLCAAGREQRLEAAPRS